MIIRTFIFLFTYWSVEAYGDVTDDDTAVAIKQGIQDYNNSIAIETSDFKDFVKKSKIFVDRSLFIKEVLVRGKQQLLLLCPNSWGKTSNLKMLQTFLEIQANEQGDEITPKESTSNYKLFVHGEITHDDGRVERLEQPFLISQHKRIMDTYLGKHPVIYVSFRDTLGENCSVIKEKMSLAISEAFKSHRYMIKVFERKIEDGKRFDVHSKPLDDLQNFNNILNPTNITHTSITRSIPFLCKVLHDHFHRKVFVLLDDYDMPIHAFLQIKNYADQDLREIIYILNFMATNTFNDSADVYSSIIMGTHMVGYPWEDYATYYLLYEKRPLREYFGINHRDLEIIFEKHDIPKALSEKAFQWYGGFDSQFSKRRFYNPSSIAMFLAKKQIGCYWKEKIRNKDFIQKALRMQLALFIKHEILLLIGKQKIQALQTVDLSYLTMDQLRKLFSNMQEIYSGSSWLFSYLMQEGYFVQVPDSEPDEFRLVSAKLPNTEIAHVMANWMITYYKYEYPIDENRLRHAANVLHEFVLSENTTTTLLTRSMEALYNATSTMMDKDLNFWNRYSKRASETTALAIYNCVALEMQRMLKFQIDVYYHRIFRVDVVMVDEKKGLGVITQVLYDEYSAEKALRVAESYQKIFTNNFTNIHTVKLIGMYVSYNTSVNILSKFIKTIA